MHNTTHTHLSDELEHIRIEVNVEVLIVWMADDEGGVQPTLGFVNGLTPGLNFGQ